MVWLVRMAPMAAVSCENMRARLKRGSAIVMMIRIIAMTISNSIREKPRRRRCRFIIRSLLYHLMTLRGCQAWRLLRDGRTGIGGADPLVRGRRPRRPPGTLHDADAQFRLRNEDSVPLGERTCPLQRPVTLRKRSSYSLRSSLTHLAAPCLSSGWSLSFHEPAAARSQE